jgi:hypothetical protein
MERNNVGITSGGLHPPPVKVSSPSSSIYTTTLHHPLCNLLANMMYDAI